MNARLRALLLFLPTLALYLYHGSVLARTAVDVPVMDEWTYLDPGALPAGLTLRWLLTPLNEHMNVPARLLVWGLHALGGGLDIARLQALNFILFGLVVALACLLVRRALGEDGVPVAAAFAPFMLTPLLHGGHAHGLQASIHFSLAFALGSALLLFARAPSRPKLLAGAFAAFCSIGSFASGHFFALTGAALFVPRRLREGRPGARLDAVLVAAGPLCALTIAFVAGAFILERIVHAPPPMLQAAHLYAASGRALAFGPGVSGLDFLSSMWTSPLRGDFWVFFLSLCAQGFGAPAPAPLLGALGLALVLAPLVVERRRALDDESVLLWAAALGALGTLAAVALGRTWMGVERLAHSHYMEFALLLPLLGAAAWARALRERPQARLAVLAAFWLFCAGASFKGWDFSPYASIRASREEGLRCIEEYYAKGGSALCPTLQPLPLAERLERAKALRLPFYRRIEAKLKP
ncbi:MAG: hypothetical protein WC969_11180 [Elusimicrobiota bacterium]